MVDMLKSSKWMRVGMVNVLAIVGLLLSVLGPVSLAMAGSGSTSSSAISMNVPEPSTLALVVTPVAALAGLVGWRRARRQKRD